MPFFDPTRGEWFSTASGSDEAEIGGPGNQSTSNRRIEPGFQQLGFHFVRVGEGGQALHGGRRKVQVRGEEIDSVTSAAGDDQEGAARRNPLPQGSEQGDSIRHGEVVDHVEEEHEV